MILQKQLNNWAQRGMQESQPMIIGKRRKPRKRKLVQPALSAPAGLQLNLFD